jgi:hypothetical protein
MFIFKCNINYIKIDKYKYMWISLAWIDTPYKMCPVRDNQEAACTGEVVTNILYFCRRLYIYRTSFEGVESTDVPLPTRAFA